MTGTSRTHLKRRLVLTLLLGVGLVGVAAAPPVGADPGPCAISTSPGGAYSVKLCITNPVNLATVSGSQAVTATVTVTGTSPGVAKTQWSLGGSYLLTDFQSPHAFTLRTTDLVDGDYTLTAVALMRDGFTSSPATLQVTYSNGVTEPPQNTNQWQPPQIPDRAWGQPTVVAAAGDGAGGESNATNVVNLVNGWDPDAFLYLGDVYEDGTLTEFRNWYGTGGSFFDRFRSVTAPVIGNHEYDGGGYFPYWDNIPHYYSYDVNGWHFVALDSTSQFGQTAPGTAQYQWLAADLAATDSPCVVVYAHHPLYTIGAETPATRLQSMWGLMRQNGVTLFLTGHDHNYQHWVPMDGAGAPDPAGVAELVVGTGGHSSIAVKSSDYRVVKQSKSYGALKMKLYGNRADFSYATSTGTVVEQDTFSCKGQDGIAPDAPGAPTVGSVSQASVDLSWPAAADNFGVTGYRLYRDGQAVGSTSGPTSLTDDTVAPSTQYSYSVSALDAAGNESSRSPAATATTPGSDATPPSVPAQLDLLATTAGVLELTWSPSTDNGTVDHYTVQRDENVLGDVTSPAYTDTGLGSGVEYCYRVSATDTSGNTSDLSAPRCGRSLDTTAPDVPDGLVGTAVGPHHVALSWNASQDNVAVTGYDVHRDGQLIDTTTTTSYEDLDVLSLADHSYRVAAFDAAGLRSGLSDPVIVSTQDGEAPTTPAGTSAVATGPNSVVMTWNASTDNTGVTGYRIFRGGVPVGTVGAGVLTFTDESVLSDTTYTYTVAARDAAGNESGPSVGAVVSTPAPAAILASADTYVSNTNPNTNYGTATALRSDVDPVHLPYFTFQVSNAQANVTRVRLRVFASTRSTKPITVRAVGTTTWGEKTITWTNAPAPGAAVGSHPAFTSPRWIDVDVTPLVTGNGPVSLMIETASTTSASYASRETTTKPQLLVDSSP